MTKILYGFAETGVNAVEILLRLHLMVFYTNEMRLPPFWVGAVLAITVFWDAITDPLIGKFSDHLKETKGSRVPLVLIGAISSAFFLVLLYQPPDFLQGEKQLLIYLLVTSLCLNTCYTLFSIPYTAMVGDYTQDRSERSKFIAWRLVFANLGAVLGIGVPGYFLAQKVPAPYENASWIIAVVVVFAALIATLRPPPKIKSPVIRRISFNEQVRMSLKNWPFIWLLTAFFALNLGLAINSSAALYYYRLRLNLSEQEIQNVLLLFLLVFSASVPVWIWLGKKFGRKLTLIWGSLGLGISNCLIYPLLPIGDATSAYLWASSFGGFWVGASVLLESTLTDVIDYDQIRSKKENFGLYFGVWKFVAKSSRAMALLFTGTLLDWAGIVFPDDLTGPRLATLFGPGVGVFFILASLLALPYALSEERVLKVKRILNRRQDRANAGVQAQ